MSAFYQVKVLDKEATKAHLEIIATHPDVSYLKDDLADPEQFCLFLLVEAYIHLREGYVKGEVEIAAHPLKAKIEEWEVKMTGKKQVVTEAILQDLEGKQNKYYQDEYVTGHTRNQANEPVLLLEPQYRLFCFDAQDHIKNAQFSREDTLVEKVEFTVTDPAMLFHLSKGLQWESVAYNLWDMWVNVVYPRQQKEQR